jgi:hypothetical protein
MGRGGGYPRMFSKRRASDFESMTCRRAGNKCVQAIKKTGVKEWGWSKRKGEFTYECSVSLITCQ